MREIASFRGGIIMSGRKNICFITATPEAYHAQRLAEGIFTQCEKYGYNVAVFASMISISFYFKDYANGEKNIYELPDFSRFDGIIFDNISLVSDNDTTFAEKVCRRATQEAVAPVLGIGIPIGDIPTLYSNNDEMFRELCRHAINVHGCKKLCLLTGMKDNTEAESRLGIMLDEIKKCGLTVADEHIIYGDFWYTSGKKLADDIADGSISMPDAVIAASDHMAIGLIEELNVKGIRVPEDIRVLGFEAVQEGALGKITLTSIESNFAKVGADAVDRIRAVIEPSEELSPYIPKTKKMMYLGKSCGCDPDIERTLEKLRASLYLKTRNYSSALFMDDIDIGLLMENYIPEDLTASQTPEECIERIHNSTFIIAPFENFSLCLREDWLENDSAETGYPKRMKLVLAKSNCGETDFCNSISSVSFNTSEMLPQMFEEHESPYVYYFSAVHFGEKTLGYAVLQRKLSDSRYFNLVYRNWLRFVNNALEMARSKNSYKMMSYHDKMTGLLNRRGMYDEYQKMWRAKRDGDKVFACVIDMDSLKHINDTYGHQEGDIAITAISRAIREITADNELSVRAGGDEFYIIGIGEYDNDGFEKRKADFYNIIEGINEELGKPYTVTASLGSAFGEQSDMDRLDSLILEADEEMYRCKMKRKMNRG